MSSDIYDTEEEEEKPERSLYDQSSVFGLH